MSTVFDYLPLSGSVCPSFGCRPFNGSVYLPFNHLVCCVCPSVFLPFNGSVCPPFLTIYHLVGQCVHLYDCLPFSGSVCPLSTFMTVYHSVGQCVHPSVCLPFSGSVSQCLCPSSIRSVCLTAVYLPFSGSVCPPFLTVYHSMGQCVHRSVSYQGGSTGGYISPVSLCVERARGHYEAGQESRPSPSPSTRVYKESSQSGKVSCSPALHLFTWLKSSS